MHCHLALTRTLYCTIQQHLNLRYEETALEAIRKYVDYPAWATLCLPDQDDVFDNHLVEQNHLVGSITKAIAGFPLSEKTWKCRNFTIHFSCHGNVREFKNYRNDRVWTALKMKSHFSSQ